MAYSTDIADRLRAYLSEYKHLQIEEKKMFGGLAFMVNDKMCINVKENALMCRYDPEQHEEVITRHGYSELHMRGKNQIGFCYVEAEGFEKDSDFKYWVDLCLEYNPKAKNSKKKK